jgi:hypothetical protein
VYKSADDSPVTSTTSENVVEFVKAGSEVVTQLLKKNERIKQAKTVFFIKHSLIIYHYSDLLLIQKI